MNCAPLKRRSFEVAASRGVNSPILRPQAQQLTAVVADVNETVRPLCDQADASGLSIHQPFFQHYMAIFDHQSIQVVLNQ
jgi:hypothetical protein